MGTRSIRRWQREVLGNLWGAKPAAIASVELCLGQDTCSRQELHLFTSLGPICSLPVITISSLRLKKGHWVRKWFQILHTTHSVIIHGELTAKEVVTGLGAHTWRADRVNTGGSPEQRSLSISGAGHVLPHTQEHTLSFKCSSLKTTDLFCFTQTRFLSLSDEI